MTDTIVGPRKTRELHNHHFDSTIWNEFRFRDDDIIISTYAKSGTTWMQQIVAQMLLGPDPELEVAEMSPWLDLRVPPKAVKLPVVEAQTHRRFLKTHLPLDALVFSPKAKYIYIGRDGRDVVWSMYNHHSNANKTWYEALNDTPGRVGPPIEPPPGDIRQYWREWLDRGGRGALGPGRSITGPGFVSSRGERTGVARISCCTLVTYGIRAYRQALHGRCLRRMGGEGPPALAPQAGDVAPAGRAHRRWRAAG